MTREEEKNKARFEYVSKRLANPDYPTYNDEYELECAYDAGAMWADAHPRWISVEEELPKDGQHTATINKAGFQAVRHYKGGKWFSSYGNEYGDITHWMPLPQAPKGGEE